MSMMNDTRYSGHLPSPAALFGLLSCLALALLSIGVPPARANGVGTEQPAPNILFISVDTLRADRLSCYGYRRPTTPNIDGLIDHGVRFTQARTIEPLTSPSVCSMLTSKYPHEHGSTRNGLRMRSGIASLPKALQAHGYRTAAYFGNWTLREGLSGLGEHFESYNEVITRRRWFGLVRGEATAEDLTQQAGDWIASHVRAEREKPFFLWVHYVEPHAPYRFQAEQAERLGIEDETTVLASDRYDTEVAFVDASIGELLDGLAELDLADETIVVFVSDHGESLGEHKYWGHGRHLYEPTLRIPMSITWPGRLSPGTVDAPALIIDLAPTLLSLIGQEHPAQLRGFDWAEVLAGRAKAPVGRLTHYQAHKGVVISRHDSDLARQSGLLEVGTIHGNRKEIFRIQKNKRWLFDLESDPLELTSLTVPKESPSEGLLEWMRTIYSTLTVLDTETPEPLDEESIEKMRSLGYVE